MCLQNNIVFTYLENEDFHKRTEDFEVIESEIIKKDEHNNLSVIVSKECKFSCRMQSRPTSTPYRPLKLLTWSESS